MSELQDAIYIYIYFSFFTPSLDVVKPRTSDECAFFFDVVKAADKQAYHKVCIRSEDFCTSKVAE